MIKVAFFDAKDYDITSFNKNITPEFEFKFFETKLTTDTALLANGFDVVCVFVNDNINKDIIDILVDQGIKIVALRCAGYNNVDLKYSSGKLHILRVPAYSPYAVAEHAMALLLTSIRRIHKAYIRTRDFNFSLTELTGFDLHGKTMGVVGTGRIGRVFINICKGFGMNVIAYDKFPAKDSDINYVTLDELFEKSDIISLHCPLTDETYHLVNKDSVEKMKKGIVIINTSRGALVDSQALLQGIKSRKIGAACLDVYEEESNVFFNNFSGHIIEDDVLARLISFPNVIVTSHQAFLTAEALENIAKTTLGNITQFLKEGKCDNEVFYKSEGY
ncbi:D-lactate dehydrogenase [Anaeromyces robustus]|jgi:D-lactate dehydrogenase|uniref:D-lactate dehydrogenase n=1 Tax=Anaeromyces robustus TaxID=1754192 RepID=A0A1Y1WVA6_9FUNG|nr:D-lactate dehydrogenase [Anaeromyces robustus]|eukprot:ORX77238.1 D-lactate dehydrogenase [Anaeromyces robustus]